MVGVKDPVEKHIIQELKKLRHSKSQLKKHIQSTRSWSKRKQIQDWQPYDFYSYFEYKYKDLYGSEYNGNVDTVRAYERMEKFKDAYNISNEDYKLFIDIAFNRYFNFFNHPSVSSIFSLELYNTLMGKNIKMSKKKYEKLDKDLEEEEKKFEEFAKNINYNF